MKDVHAENQAKDYRALVENLSDILYTIDNNAVVTYVSPNISQLSGYQPGEVIGRKFIEFVHPDDLPGRREQFLKILSGVEEATEYRFLTKSGAVKWARTSARPIINNGEVVGAQGILVDITDRKDIEDALRRSEEKYRILIQHAKDAIFVIQGNYIRFMNPSASEILGYTCDSIADRPFWEFVHPDDRQWLMDRYALRMRGESLSDRTSFRILSRHDGVRDVDLNVVSISWEGRPAVLNFLRDVTLQKMMEAQLRNAQKMEALGTLAGGIAHNFNNLLMGIHGNASLCLHSLEPWMSASKYIEKIVKLVNSGSKLTCQLLDYARGGRREVECVDVNALVREVSETFMAAKKQIEVRHSLCEEIPCIKADQSQIDQVLLNLLLNAADAMPDGGEVVIETTCLTGRQARAKAELFKDKQYVLLKVSDHGAGIPKKIRERIFEPFFTTKWVGQGTGLGLSTAYGIVKNHEGDICVESEVNQGSCFFVYLPAWVEGSAEAVPAAVPETVAARGTILLVEDEPTVADASSKLLEHFGFKVFTARDGATAMKIFEENWPSIDIVVLDLILPQMSGQVLYYKFREIDPQVRVLISSGYGLAGQAEELLANGCVGFVQKPYDINHLSARIMEILSGE